MIYRFLFLILFVNIVLSLRCKKAWPPNCISNSTCLYDTTECISSKNIRGGIYCSTLIKLIDHIIIGSMDCMYDQETTKTCKNQSQCIMEYTNNQQTFLHCCCDQDYCNFNFTLNNSSKIDSLSFINEEDCKNWLSKPIVIIIICIIIALILIIIIGCFIYRKKFLKSLNKFGILINKSNKSPENRPFITKEEQINEQEINFNDLIIGNEIKRGRFSSIYEGIYNKNPIAIKILSYQNSNDESFILFQHEKEIYSLPFLNHINILKYYGYSKSSIGKLCLITELSQNGSLKDVLRSRLLKDKSELFLILKQISCGLEYLHKEHQDKNGLNRPSIAHRDLKTENILYLNDNQLVICDFAMSTILDQNQNGPNKEQQIGTPRYMSPELLAGTIGCEKEALLKCDVYALGIIIWEVLSRYPFKDLVISNKDSNCKYSMPFEKQLIENGLNVNNPQVIDMSRIMILKKPFDRPLINESWEYFNLLDLIIKTMKECWDEHPEARLTSPSVARRFQQLII